MVNHMTKISSEIKKFSAINIVKTGWLLIWSSLILEGLIIFSLGFESIETNHLSFILTVSLFLLIVIASSIREILLFNWKKNIDKNYNRLILFSNIYGCSVIAINALIMLVQSLNFGIGFWFVISNIVLVLAIPITVCISNLAYIITIVSSFLFVALYKLIACNFDFGQMQSFVYVGLIYCFSIIMQITLNKAFIANYHFQKKAYDTADIQIKVSQELLKLNEELRHDSLTDSLTNLGNRKALEMDSKIVWEECYLEKKPLCVVMIDIDSFKMINDTFGHPVGDIILRKISQMMNENSISNNGLAYRYGGEEFLMVFKGVKTNIVEEYMKNLSLNVETTYFKEVSSHKVSISIGIHEGIPEKEFDFPTYVTEADRKMYRNKNAKSKAKKNER